MTTLPAQDQEPAGSAAPGAGEAAETPGGWLRRQRQAQGWTVPQMARRLREAAKNADDSLPAHDSLVGMIRRWERGPWGVSERYRLHVCRVLGVPPGQFGTGEPDPASDRADPPEPGAPGTSLPARPVRHVWSVIAPPLPAACRGTGESDHWV